MVKYQTESTLCTCHRNCRLSEIEKTFTEFDDKLTAKVDTSISKFKSIFIAEINKIYAEIDGKLTAEAKKIKTCDDDFTREAQKIFSMVNNITTKVNNIEEACRNEFGRINVVIKNFQNEINQHYTVVQRSNFDQQSVSNESEANSTNESETNSRGSSSNSSQSSSSGSSNLSGILDITSDIKICFKQHFDRLMKLVLIIMWSSGEGTAIIWVGARQAFMLYSSLETTCYSVIFYFHFYLAGRPFLIYYITKNIIKNLLPIFKRVCVFYILNINCVRLSMNSASKNKLLFYQFFFLKNRLVLKNGRKPNFRKRGNPDPKTLRNRLLVEIIKEKLSTEGLISIDEKSEVAISFFEGLKFKHDQRVQAEQTLKDAVECLLNYHEKEGSMQNI
ncbi:hypothetical protein RclHR1_16970002 [Rhizophagus clarus]|uniref:Uncharacterized protein n=1 Tax=Rhizophagus clarus TaxID=94130 RepID=A0A2Z6QIZ2_9GLOM|nr:hypothetical protein RclHR1_16970002 [Rhizophagus clarus]